MPVSHILVRPICIPCTQETSEALQLDGNSTCLQQGDIKTETVFHPYKTNVQLIFVKLQMFFVEIAELDLCSL